MNLHNTITIAIDFDGTIVENAYPRIGKTRIFAFETMRKLMQDGHRLILWTYRHGERLDEAVAFCKENGVEFYAINKSFPEEQFDDTQSRKILADLFIDDRNIGGVYGWGEVYQMLTDAAPPVPKKQRKGLFRFLKR
ncbi:MAG: hydrolase [Bacteroidia bacterium]|nr:hydrolase [Bacteroidia bacterium]MBT8268577.1 hydrolase [Bacteroidia bacterium]NNK69618.1 hydrolase [Flavobacteriaceae bacterium]NNL79724.1 hydrolase [Flavobacteriaceae bacterium]